MLGSHGAILRHIVLQSFRDLAAWQLFAKDVIGLVGEAVIAAFDGLSGIEIYVGEFQRTLPLCR